VNLDHVFAKVTTVASDLGYPVTVTGGSHWLADDPLVLAHPDLFTRDCRYGLAFSGEPPEVLALPPDDEPEPSGLTPRRPRAQAGRT